MDGWQTTDLRAIRNGEYVGTERYTTIARKPYYLPRFGEVWVLISEWSIDVSQHNISDPMYSMGSSIKSIFINDCNKQGIDKLMELGFTQFQVDVFLAIYNAILHECEECYGRPCTVQDDCYKAVHEAKYTRVGVNEDGKENE